MQFSIIALLSFAVMAIATPTTGQYVQTRSLQTRAERTAKQAAEQCTTNQTPACCNQDNSVTNDNSPLGGLLAGAVGTSNCSPWTLNLLSSTGGDVKAQEVCKSEQVVACCEGDKQKGLINEDAVCQEV